MCAKAVVSESINKSSDRIASGNPSMEFENACQTRSIPAIGSAIGNLIEFVYPIPKVNIEYDLEKGDAGVTSHLPPTVSRKHKSPEFDNNTLNRSWSSIPRRIQTAVIARPKSDYQRWPSQQTTHQSADDWEMGFKRALDTCQNRARTRECSPLPDTRRETSHRKYLTDTALSEYELPVPQHRYGEESWEWMDAFASLVPCGDSPFEPAPPVEPGTTILELSTENLRAHDHAEAVAHARNKLFNGYPSRPQPAFPQQPHHEADMVKDIHQLIMRDQIRHYRHQCALSVFAMCAWCVQLLLSLGATCMGVIKDNFWIFVYVSGALGILFSLFHLVRYEFYSVNFSC